MKKSPKRSRSRSPKRQKWNAPKRKNRSAYKKRCGSKCLLQPKLLKYPICDSNCRVSCSGLHAAMSRAGQYHHPKIYKAAAKQYYRSCSRSPPRLRSRSLKREF